MATLAAGEVSIYNWVLLLIRQKERIACRIASQIRFKVPTSQALLRRFYEIINVQKTLSPGIERPRKKWGLPVLYCSTRITHSFLQQAYIVSWALHTVPET